MSVASVRTTPWIAVLTDRGHETLSLEDTLLRGHQIRELTTRDDLERSATLRLLTSFATLIARESALAARGRRIPRRPGEPETVVDGAVEAAARAGFNPHDVTAVLDRFDEQLYLIHPVYPFMQDHRAETANARPAATLHPAVTMTQVWFTGQDAANRPLDPAGAIVALITAHFHGLTTNGGAEVAQPDKTTFTFTRQTGSVGTRMRHDAHLWWEADNLTATLLMNVKRAWVRGDTSLPAFLETPSVTRPIGSLSEWTHSGFTALLDAVEGDDGEPQFVHAHISGLIVDNPGTDKTAYNALAKEQVNRSRDADPRRVYLDVVPSKGTPFRRQVTGLNPLNTPVQNLAKWWTVDGAARLATGLLEPLDDLNVRVAVLAIEANENPTSLVIRATGWTTLDRRSIGDGVTDTSILSDLAASASINVESTLRTAARTVFSSSGPSASASAAAFGDDLIDSFYVNAREVLDQAVELAHIGEPIPFALQRDWWAAALTAFDEVAMPLANVSLLPRIASARAKLVRYAGRPVRAETPAELNRAVARVIERASGDRGVTADIRKALRPQTEHAAYPHLSVALAGLDEDTRKGFLRGIGLAVDRTVLSGGQSLAGALTRISGEHGVDIKVGLLPGLRLEQAVEVLDGLIERAAGTGARINAFDVVRLLTRWETGDRKMDRATRNQFVFNYFNAKERP